MRKSNAEIAYEANIRPMLGGLGGSYDIRFLGRDWRVSGDDVAQLGGEPGHVNAKGVLVWYFTYSDRAGEPSYEFASISSFSHGIFGNSSWISEYDIDLERFRTTCDKLGAHYYRKERYGESRLLEVLPKIITLLTYNEGDDEFPNSIDIKYGKNATDFLPFETLAVLHSLLNSEFRNM